MLPALPPLHGLSISMDTGPSRKRRASMLPCNDVVFYNDDERLIQRCGNTDNHRVWGPDAVFERPGEPEEKVALFRRGLTVEGAKALHTSTPDMKGVLQVLYENPKWFKGQEQGAVTDPDLSYKWADSSKTRQFEVRVLETETVVTHILDYHFWRRDATLPVRGDEAWTRGWLYCNASPNWMYKAEGGNGDNEPEIVIRCTVKLPAKSKVILDKAPFYSAHCLTDSGKLSIFPDVIIPPAAFRVDTVTHYCREEPGASPPSGWNVIKPFDYDEAKAKRKARGNAGHESHIYDNKEYAARILEGVSKFVHVQMSVTDMLEMPMPTLTEDGFVREAA